MPSYTIPLFPSPNNLSEKVVSLDSSKERDNKAQVYLETAKVSGYCRDARPNGSLTGTTRSVTEELHAVPIAVVGMSFRFPQGLESAESFWEALEEGRSAWSTFPKDRINPDGVYDPDEERLNAVRNSVFLHRMILFC